MNRPARAHGLSLVELLLGLAVTALLLAPLAPMLDTAHAAARVTGEQAALEREAGFALERIAARIRATPASSSLQNQPDSEWLKPAVYAHLDNGTLVERQNGAEYPLADSVTAFELSAPPVQGAGALIQVSLTLQRGDASASASATVRMGSAL